MSIAQGPCEIWLDDTRVMQDDDCEATFGSAIPKWKIDFSSCKGSCMLRWFWLGLQNSGELWQVYSTLQPQLSLGSLLLVNEWLIICTSGNDGTL